MSSFGSKRKPRIIKTLDDEEPDQAAATSAATQQSQNQSSQPQAPIKFGRRPIKSSSLRKSINFNDDEASQNGAGDAAASTAADSFAGDDSSAPVVIRPGLAKQKKKTTTSSPRPSSFQPPGEGRSDGDEGERTSESTKKKKKSLGHKALEQSASSRRSSASLQNLPARFIGGDDDRPRYSKEYLDELQNSTPNAPQNLSELRIVDDDDFGGQGGNGGGLGDDAMALDPSELDGATIVRTSAAISRPSVDQPAATVLTDAQVREKKERRARLAREAEFISLDDDQDGSDGSDDDGQRGGRIAVQFEKKNKSEPRLIAEDEDLGEGYDDFVEDGGLSVGRKAEKEARKRQRQEMADLIQAAEDGSDVDTDDSEAERRAAYETAQQRAGMDGLHRPDEDADTGGRGANVIPRMRPLPDLEDCLQRMRDMVQGIEDEVVRRRKNVADMEREKEEILQREKEVQEILNQAGVKYQSVTAGPGASVAANLVTPSPLRPMPPGLASDVPMERGLESFGTTPTLRPDIEEMS